LEKSKFYKLKVSFFTSSSSSLSSKEHSYAQASKNNIKNNFSDFLTKKIEEAHKILNDIKKERPKINMIVIRQVCGQTWTRVRVKYYNY